ncbi:hypothetical protein BD414DRAFT_490253 [Trametes punicea]|nr:hypothetical protein BD414DRAFT_490253 [Trametes punicea]
MAAADDAPASRPDLRPDVYALLEGVLTVLEDTLPANQSASATGKPPAGTSASSAVAAVAAVPGPIDIRTFLALECVRELEKLYLPYPHDLADPSDLFRPSLSSRTDENPLPDSSWGTRPGLASDSPSRGYSRPATSDTATTSGSIPPYRAPSSSSQPAWLGTQEGAQRALPSLGSGPPRAARNLGETYSGTREAGRPCGPVSPAGSSAGMVPHAPAAALEPEGNSVRAGAVAQRERDIASALPPSHGKAKSARRQTGRGEGRETRIAKLARKDAAWWLCTVLDRLLPSLPPRSSFPSAPSAEHDLPPVGSPPEDAGSAASTRGPGASCSDVANEAVYFALVDLLRRTRPRLPASLRSTGVHRTDASPSPSSPSPRGLSDCASNHAQVREEAAASASASVPEPREMRVDTEAENSMLPDVDAGGDAEMDLGTGGKPNPKSKPDSKPKSKQEKTTGKHAGAGRPGQDSRDRREGCVDADAGSGAVPEMGEVERGMLLAVLERAWLGV